MIERLLLPLDRHNLINRSNIPQWQMTFDLIQEAVCWLDGEGQMIHSNRALCRLCHQLEPENRDRLAHELHQAVKNQLLGQEDEPELSYELPLGDRWLQITTTQINDEASEQIITVCLIVDLTMPKLSQLATEKLAATNQELLQQIVQGKQAQAELQRQQQVMQALVENSSEFKRIELALRQSEARFRRLLESNMIGMGFWNIQGQITAANDAFLKIIGYAQADLLGGKLNSRLITPPEYAHLDRRYYKQILKSGYCSPYEKEFIRSDGNRISVLVGGALFEETTDSGVFFVLDLTERKQLELMLKQVNLELETRVQERTVALQQAIKQLEQEITERLLVEEALQASNEELGSINMEVIASNRELQHLNAQLAASYRDSKAESLHYWELCNFIPDAYLLTGLDGIILEANQAAGVLFGSQPITLVGQNIASLVVENDREKLQLYLEQFRQPRCDSGQINPSLKEQRSSFQLQLATKSFQIGNFTIAYRFNIYGEIIGWRWLLQTVIKD